MPEGESFRGWAQYDLAASTPGATWCHRSFGGVYPWVDREYCDRYIMTGAEVAKAKGLDPQTYVSSTGTRMQERLRYYPNWTP